jgi:hypothetical protein
MNRYTETNVWNDPRSYAPDPFANLAAIEHYEKVARQLRRKNALNPGRIVTALCLAIVVFNIVFWGGQLLRVFL